MHTKDIQKIIWLSGLLFSVFFSGCGDQSEEVPYITVSAVAGEFPKEAGEYALTIESNTVWSAEYEGAWLSMQPRTGTGSTACVVTVDENIGGARSLLVRLDGTSVSDSFTLSQQGVTTLSLSEDSLKFPEAGGAAALLISTPYRWSVNNAEDAPWVEFSRLSGEEGETVTLTTLPVTERALRGPVDVRITSGIYTRSLSLYQEISNRPPDSFGLLAPADGETLGNFTVSFAWEKADDPDDDPVTYQLQISADQKTWKTIYEGKELSATGEVDAQSAYWKVIATDPLNGVAESGVYTFSVSGPADGDVSIYQENTIPGAQPVHIVILGDGYIAKDYLPGGDFHKHVKSCVDALFDIAPYKTYREYFKITVLTAISAEQGVTILSDFTSGSRMKAQKRNTKFGCECAGGNSTSITVKGDLVQSFLQSALGVGATQRADYSVFMVVNVDAWAGTCTVYSSGFSIGRSAADYNLGKRMVHEGAGHGFGRLKDEYLNYPNETIPADDVTRVTQWRKTTWSSFDPWWYAGNVDLTGDREKVHWKEYFTRTGYNRVSLIEGCYLYGKGAWRPETSSIMQGSSSVFYFNAPSREAIVRRIMRIAGLEFSITDFLARDDNTMPLSRANYVEMYLPDTPPELIDDREVR